MLQISQGLTETFAYVFPEDDAVDQAHADYNDESYDETLDDKHLPLLAGQRPTKFFFKPLSRKAMSIVRDLVAQSSGSLAVEMALAHSLQRIENGFASVEIEHKHGRLTEKCMDSLHEKYGSIVTQRLGSVVLGRSVLSPFLPRR